MLNTNFFVVVDVQHFAIPVVVILRDQGASKQPTSPTCSMSLSFRLPPPHTKSHLRFSSLVNYNRDFVVDMSGSAKRRGRREHQLGKTQSAQSSANNNPETQAEALHLSEMNNNQLLQHAFRNTTLGFISVPHARGWETDFAFIMSDKPEVSTYLEPADLSTIKKSFSISTYLSPAGVGQLAPKVILHNGGPIDGALLACLALNEECYREGTGVFYHLPPHQNKEIGHASDLVFKVKRWTREDKYRWDEAGWSKRLDMYGIDEKCFGRSLIVAI